jgi:hypothetical protein
MANRHISGKWWDKEKKHEEIFAFINHLEKHGNLQKNRFLSYARLYSGRDLAGLYPHNYSKTSSETPLISGDSKAKIRLNVIAAVIDTLAAKVSKNKPKVVLLPSGGDWELQRKAKKLEKFISGLFYGSDVYNEAQKAFIDAAVFGIFVLHPFEREGNICVERVLPSELYVDDEDAMYGKPRQMHRTKYVSRDVVIELFPEHKDKIKVAPKEDEAIGAGYITDRSVADHVKVVESWHLPSSANSTDGRHVISLQNVTLLDEEYNKEDFPFVIFRYKESLMGFWGTGVCEELIGIQVEINRLLYRIQQQFHRLSNPMIFVPTGSVISKAHLSNDIGIMVPFSGPIPPQIKVHQTVHPEIIMHLDKLYMRAFEIIGISALSATSRKPEGLNSGRAIMEYNDIETERFAIQSQRYENVFIEIAKKFICLARDLYRETEGFDLKVTVDGREFIETIDWADVDMPDDKFILKVGAASILPETKAGRAQVVTEWLQIGAITPEEWRDLLDIPDLEEHTEMKRAPKDYIKQSINNMIDTMIPVEPEPFDDIIFALEYATLMYQKGKMNNMPEPRLELLRQYMDKITAIMADAEEQERMAAMEMQAAMAPPGMEEGVPQVVQGQPNLPPPVQ